MRLTETQGGARVDRDGDARAGARRRSVTGDGGIAGQGAPHSSRHGRHRHGRQRRRHRRHILAQRCRTRCSPSRRRKRQTHRQCGALRCRTCCKSRGPSYLPPRPMLTTGRSRSALQPDPLAHSGNRRSDATRAEALNRLPATFRHRGWTPISYGLADARQGFTPAADHCLERDSPGFPERTISVVGSDC